MGISQGGTGTESHKVKLTEAGPAIDGSRCVCLMVSIFEEGYDHASGGQSEEQIEECEVVRFCVPKVRGKRM